MYGMTGKLTAQAGKRERLVEILLRASQVVGQMPGCRLYAVTEVLSDEVSVMVMEIWDNQPAHDDSLKDPRVRALIAEAMPLIGGAPTGDALNVIGGHGIRTS